MDFSVIGITLNAAKSQLAIPAERSRGSRRGSFPNAKVDGWLKSLTLNHSLTRLCDEPVISC